jgi:hypothetical protein
MPIALTPNETWKYQLEDDRKNGKLDPKGTLWTLRPITGAVQRQIQDLIQFEFSENKQLVLANRGRVLELLLAHGVCAVENWADAAGKPISVELQKVNGCEVANIAFADRLLPQHQTELGNAIDNRTKVRPPDSD